MQKFNRALHGYDPDEVNKFLDDVINQVDEIIRSNKEKDNEIRRLKNLLSRNETNPELIEKAKKYDELASTLNKAIDLARENGEKIIKLAEEKRDLIIEEAQIEADNIIKNAKENK